ncbi:BTB/POZ domain-containing protein 7, partial [Melitaea cinxia]|uniref:BTB/POZ domain-containing protein 7 n=1 Tax=Melitaea cinxia TaxID=113334 RepID=UPI001E27410D
MDDFIFDSITAGLGGRVSGARRGDVGLPMSRLLCCLRACRPDMGAALSHPQEGGACDGGAPASPPTMADVIRERKKKAGGAGLGTLRRRIAAAARRPRDARPDRGCEHARFIRSVVSSWRLAEVFLLCEELEAGAALRDLATQAELAREPAPRLHADLARLLRDRWWCDVEVVGAGWSLPAHRVILAARCTYFRDLLVRYPNSCRIPLEGVGGALSRDEVEACVLALYGGPAAGAGQRCDRCSKWDRGIDSEAELDIISVENSTLRRGCSCGRPRVDAARLRRLADLLGFSPDALHRDMRYLLDSGELCDARLSWQVEGAAGGGGQYGFRSALELPCHRLLLAARSRFFRSVMSRRGASGAGTVCVDEKVLPRRFARALLHAAYTDQVDLTLIGRTSSSPSSTNSSGNGGTLRGSGPRGSSLQMLDDAFQLYEIARFLEMPIVAQGCEDAMARALNADTLPHILRWSQAPHASAWLHRQAMRFLRDEFPAAMAAGAAGRLPRGALAAALGSPFLQAGEAQALRALLRWAERAAHGIICVSGASAGSEGARACVSARTLAALRARVAELRAAAPAQRALRLHAPDTLLVRRQIALRAVREMSLPDSCADLLLGDADAPADREGSAEWEGGARVPSAGRSDGDDDCCRSGSGSLLCVSGGSSTIASIDNNQRAGTCRRELPARPSDTHLRSGSWNRARLSAAVPDVAMAPNANTHLLTARDYP